jgi:predicted RNA-binding protein with PUA-like domain
MPTNKKRPAAKAKPAPKAAPPAAKKPSPTGASGAPHAEGAWSQWFVRSPGERRYWLVKSEPETFSFDDLQRAPNKTTGWDGVRNLAARNFMRDGMKVGDQVFFYHSQANPPAVVGVCEVVREGYPDPTALDPKHAHHDPGSDPNKPTWYQVDVRAIRPLARPVGLPELKAKKELAGMALLRIGRLSVTPVSAAEWKVIEQMAEG